MGVLHTISGDGINFVTYVGSATPCHLNGTEEFQGNKARATT